MSDKALLYFVAMFELAAGLAIVLVHNVWSGGWPIIITVVGWLMVIEGTAVAIFPVREMQKLFRGLTGKGWLNFWGLIVLVIGAYLTYIGFWDKIKFMKTWKNLILTLFFVLFFLPQTLFSENQFDANFFYGDGCSHCAAVEPLIDHLKEKYSEVTFAKHEVYKNRENLTLLNSFYDQRGVDNNRRGVPVLFVGDEMLLGDKEIEIRAEQEIKKIISERLSEKQNNEIEISNATAVSSKNVSDWQQVAIPTLIGAAVVDSINPCAMAVLVILLTALLASGSKKRALYAGLAFTVSIYISYLAFGFGLFSALHFSGLAGWFNKVIGIIAILIGLANIKDFFWYGGGGFIMEIPQSWRPKMKSLLKSTTTPLGAFLIGFVVMLFELPCTGGPYFVILSLLAEKTTQTQAIPLLLLYNFFFILPLLIITFLIFVGYSSVDKIENWRNKNLRVLHLVAGIIMCALGVVLVLFI
jgi:cytochrome c biogenesis protein CcdA/glutaredoxin